MPRRPPGAKVTLLNVMPQAGIDAVLGDARDLSRYGDGEFDVVFSNSCIGHVGGFEDQLRMAREIRRVGRRYFVQTPNHGLPIDWRILVQDSTSSYRRLKPGGSSAFTSAPTPAPQAGLRRWNGRLACATSGAQN